jgi:hypothetical protein
MVVSYINSHSYSGWEARGGGRVQIQNIYMSGVLAKIAIMRKIWHGRKISIAIGRARRYRDRIWIERGKK